MFYVFTDGKSFIRIRNNNKGSISINKTGKIELAAYWNNKTAANSWKAAIERKHPTFKLKPATLKVI